MPTLVAFQANPLDLEKLQMDKELREISLSIAPESRRYFQLVNLGAVRIADVSRYLQEYKPDIFHFSGHGNEKGELMFLDADGDAQKVNHETMKLLFEKMGRQVKCVVLSSCFSKPLAKMLSKFVPFVVCTTEPIEENLAIVFTANFYSALSSGYSVKDSFDIARLVLAATNPAYTKIAELYFAENQKDLHLFKQPVVMARFETKGERPILSGIHYNMRLWVENLPTNAFSVVYNYNHESVLDDQEEFLNDGSG